MPFETKDKLEQLSFDIYLLGHDSCANHEITLSTYNNNFDIEGTGKIALTYAGQEAFDYEFEAFIKNVCFNGFEYPRHWSLKKATQAFKNVLVDYENYEFVDLNPKSNVRQYKLIRKS